MDELKFYSLVNDTTFKYLFKKDNVRSFFLNIIKYYTDLDLFEYNLIDNEINSGNIYIVIID